MEGYKWFGHNRKHLHKKAVRGFGGVRVQIRGRFEVSPDRDPRGGGLLCGEDGEWYVDGMVIFLDDEETMRLGLKILKNGVGSGQSRAVQAYLMQDRMGRRELERNLMLMERE